MYCIFLTLHLVKFLNELIIIIQLHNNSLHNNSSSILANSHRKVIISQAVKMNNVSVALSLKILATDLQNCI